MIAVFADLQQTNCKLRLFFERVSSSNGSQANLSSDLVALLPELLQAEGWLREELSPDDDPTLQREISQYRHNLERLRNLLPDLRARLLTERARIESERAHLEAASAWVRASHQL